VRWFFDTSVLVQAFLADREHHDRSLDAFLRADKAHDCCAAHSLAEFYAVVTRLPGKHRMNGDQVVLLLDNIRERLTTISLSVEEYRSVLSEAAKAQVFGGMIYDALIARCAQKASCEILYTWNVKHFERFGSDVVKRVRTP
jgi:predicted nucleic acid-binding protein